MLAADGHSSPSSFPPPRDRRAPQLSRAVFLAEDQTGADASPSVGPVGPPVRCPVLHRRQRGLPWRRPTRLGSSSPSNIIVLGGPRRSPTRRRLLPVAPPAAATATRDVRRQPYATSVAIAEQLFNLYPDYVSSLGAGGYSDQLFGLAHGRGLGAGSNHVGWPDALASAYYLASLGTAPAPAG